MSYITDDLVRIRPGSLGDVGESKYVHVANIHAGVCRELANRVCSSRQGGYNLDGEASRGSDKRRGV